MHRRVPTFSGLLFSALFIIGFAHHASGQNVIIRGVVKDIHSDERIPFASIQFKKTGSGKLTDSVGNFAFGLNNWPNDTLEVTYVGYQDNLFVIDSSVISRAVNNVLDITIFMERGKYATEVVVKRTIDRGWLMWRRIVRKKPVNDRYRFNNFSYELYNKLELDIKNINKDKWREMKLLKNFKFIFDNVDTSEGKPILPIYLTESISNY